MKENRLFNWFLYCAICLVVTFASCKKAIEIGTPPNVLTPDKVFDNDSTAIAATIGDYTSLGTFDANFIPYVGLYVDELNQPILNTTSTQFYDGNLSVTNGTVANEWQYLYVTIYKANANLASLKSAVTLTDSIKNQCIGEALFIRAYCHFNLVNLFGDVPLITTTDVRVTANAPRTPVSQVYNQIVADLLEAKTLLSANYPTTEKIRPNKWAASALLARVYLYEQNWAQAESEASVVIGSGAYSLSSLSTLFYENSSEAIWQLWNPNGFSSLNTLVPASSGTPLYIISSSLMGAFESGDQRETNWTESSVASGITFIAPYKYKVRSMTIGSNAEYTMYLRLAEQFLIRAEARAQQNNNLAGALSDLNIIRSRAGLPDLSSLTQMQILQHVAQERRVELFAEGGHRFFDLKRTNLLNPVMSVLKTTWSAVRSPLFPIPQTQISINASLSQNAGY